MKLGLAPRIPSCFWRFGADSRDSRGVEIGLVVQRMDTGQGWKVSESRKTKTERKVWVAVTANGHRFVTCRRKSYIYIFLTCIADDTGWHSVILLFCQQKDNLKVTEWHSYAIQSIFQTFNTTSSWLDGRASSCVNSSVFTFNQHLKT